MRGIRKRRTWALVVLAGAALIGAATWQLAPVLRAEAESSVGRGDYHLQTAAGAPFDETTLVGAPSAVFFGFTHCPEVCPTTLGDISLWQEALADHGEQLSVYFVTVDPERDTAEVLGDYVSWVDGVTGVTGSRAEIDKALKAFKVYAAKVPLDDGGYTMDHSAFVLLFDEKGRYVDVIRYQEPEEQAVPKIRALLEG